MTKNWEKICIRPVINPENYSKYEKICQKIANIYFTGDPKVIERNLVEAPKDSRFVTAHTIFKVAEAKCPAYWIQTDLLTALMNSQMELEPEGLKWAMKTGIVMLPHSIVRSPGGHSTEAILWHITDRELFWVAICGEDFFCRRLVLNSSKNHFTDASNYSDDVIADFNDYLQPIFLRIMVLMEARPELIEESTDTTIVNKGFAKNKAKALYQPIWIGKDYRLKTLKSKDISGGGTHASPKMHWRRGFLRSQPCGEGRKQRKMIWIEPTLVMSSSEIENKVAPSKQTS